jgi:acetyl esterase/lipase
MKLLALALGTLCTALAALAQSGPAFPLWPDGTTPGALGTTTNDVPTLTPYLPDNGLGTNAAMVICPGGGYGGLANHEGHDYAEFLRQRGVASLVLRYRLGSKGYRHPVMLQDAARAVRLVRHRAAELRIDPDRVGIMGSSAGGHLASTLLTHFDLGRPDATDPVERLSSRPTLGVLCYPVVTLGEFTHQGSKQNLLGPNPSPELVTLLSNELQVTSNTPPAFLWHTWEDKAVPVENTLQFASALRRAGVRFDLHVYQKGGHGIGLQARPPAFEHPHPWAADLVFWLQAQGFVK